MVLQGDSHLYFFFFFFNSLYSQLNPLTTSPPCHQGDSHLIRGLSGDTRLGEAEIVQVASLACHRSAILHHLRRPGESCPAPLPSLISSFKDVIGLFWNELKETHHTFFYQANITVRTNDSLQWTFEILGYPYFKPSGVSSKLSGPEERLLPHFSSGFPRTLGGCGSMVSLGFQAVHAPS